MSYLYIHLSICPEVMWDEVRWGEVTCFHLNSHFCLPSILWFDWQTCILEPSLGWLVGWLVGWARCASVNGWCKPPYCLDRQGSVWWSVHYTWQSWLINQLSRLAVKDIYPGIFASSLFGLPRLALPRPFYDFSTVFDSFWVPYCLCCAATNCAVLGWAVLCCVFADS
jgi:hypothetical protein